METALQTATAATEVSVTDQEAAQCAARAMQERGAVPRPCDMTRGSTTLFNHWRRAREHSQAQ